jgi:ketopantoate reductase
MQTSSVLIVGAGAMGLVAGYHLNLGGAEVTFLVRPGRKETFSPPQRLYCYDDNSLRVFDNYQVIESIAERSEVYDFVIVTLDGATTRGEAGTQVLRYIGQYVKGSKTIVLMGGVGIGLREHYLTTTELPESQIMGGFLGLLSHQTSANLPVIPPIKAELIQQCSVAYGHTLNNDGFLVENRYPEIAKRFKNLYDRCKVSRCGKLSVAMTRIITNSAFPFLGAADLAGWPKVADLVANRELWQLACNAQSEICSLPQHGWQGKLAGILLTPWISAKLQLKMERACLPLDYQAFNRFHHGGKVRAQDIEVMVNCLNSGQNQGHPMPALKELLRRLDSVS